MQMYSSSLRDLAPCRLSDRRQELAPQVAVWQEYDADAKALHRERERVVRRAV